MWKEQGDECKGAKKDEKKRERGSRRLRDGGKNQKAKAQSSCSSWASFIWSPDAEVVVFANSLSSFSLMF